MEEPADVTADRIVRDLLMTRAGNQSTRIHINAEGFGVWIAATAAAVMFGCNLFLAALVIDHNRQISDLRDYLAAIYAQAPHLKPKD